MPAGTRAPRCAPCSPGPTGTSTRCRPRVPAGGPAPRRGLRPLRRRSAHWHGRGQARAAAGHAGPRAPDPATGPGRYGMHDLLRAYARELAAQHDGEEEQWAALTRLFDYYLHAAAAAMDALYPAERHHRPRIPPPATPLPPVTGPGRGACLAGRPTDRLVAVAGMPPRTAGPPTRPAWPPPCSATSTGRPLPRDRHHPQPRPRRGPADR